MTEPLRQTFFCPIRLVPEQPLPSRLFLPGAGDPRPQECDYTDPEKAWQVGIDLYNHGYFWEAHEAWEYLWLQHPRQSSKALFVRGLIQTAAALLKLRLHNSGGVKKLSVRSLETLGAASDKLFFGVDGEALYLQLKKFWEPVAKGELPPLEDFPRVTLIC